MAVQVINGMPIRSELPKIVCIEKLKRAILNENSKRILSKIYSFLIDVFKKQQKYDAFFSNVSLSINEYVLNEFCFENNAFEFANNLILNCKSEIILFD